MDLNLLSRVSETEWRIERQGPMRVPAVIYATEALVQAMDAKVYEQICNVAALPGIVEAAYAMPDAHWGYGFPIGGVAAFDPEQGGVVSAGGVGFDISCGVRMLHTRLKLDELMARQKDIADSLFRQIPAGVGSHGRIKLSDSELSAMLRGGARWAVERGYGRASDLERIEEGGQMRGAEPGEVSERARERQKPEMGTLGSGNHYLEIQRVAEVFDERLGRVFGLAPGDVVLSIHCGSRGLGHQIGTDYLTRMAMDAPRFGIRLPDRELACAPLRSALGESYLGAMRAAINCALANRQILTALTRSAFREVFGGAVGAPGSELPLLYDVSHNTCKEESHGGRRLFVHRKGATRAFGPGHPELPEAFREVGQPVIIGGSMGTSSYVLVGTEQGERRSFSSACHGAGRAMSRTAATRQWQGRSLIRDLEAKGILIRSASYRGVAEEAPGAYKDVGEVVDAAHVAGLASKVARVEPLVCVKG